MSDARLHVGAWSAAITPELGRGMAGYAARMSAADGVHDDLTCRVVVFDKDDVALVLVVFDLLYIPAALAGAVSAQVAHALDTPPARVLVAATHTHCGPAVGDDHEDLHARLVRTATATAVQARGRARAVELRSVRFDVTGLVYNRRDPAGPVDQTATALIAVDDTAQVVTSLINLACHPTILEAGTTSYSRDFPGALCDTVEWSCGGQAVFLQGFAGDVNPLFHDHTVADMQLFGRQIGVRAADAILTAMRAAVPNWTVNLSADRALPVRLGRSHSTLPVPALSAATAAVTVETKPQHPPARIRQELATARAAAAEAGSAEMRDLATAKAQEWWVEDLMSTRPGYLCVDFPPPEGGTLPVQVFALGDRFRVVALPGEPMTASASRLRQELGEDLLLVGYANQAASYLPVREELGRHGYEVGSTRYAPGTVERLTDAALTLVNTAPSSSETGPARGGGTDV